MTETRSTAWHRTRDGLWIRGKGEELNEVPGRKAAPDRSSKGPVGRELRGTVNGVRRHEGEGQEDLTGSDNTSGSRTF